MKNTVTAFLLVAAFIATSAYAQAQRTFVSGTGNDANNCSRTAPCRNFAAAVAATADGGEVIVLDSAGYGPVTLTTTISLIAPPGVYAGISVFTGDGVTVNVPPGAVALRGLTINGLGGTNGINVIGAIYLDVENCVLSGFEPVALNGRGLSVTAANAHVIVENCVATRNDYGFWFEAGATGRIGHSRADNSLGDGFVVTGANPVITIADSGASNSGFAGIVVGGGTATAAVRNCVVSNNQVGISSVGTVAVSGSTLSSNGTAFSNSSGSFVSLGNNTLVNNTTNTSGTITPLATQ